MKKQRIKFGELRSFQTTIEQLEDLLAGLRAGMLSLADSAGEISLRPGSAVHFQLHAESDGERERLELVLDWRRKSLNVGSVPSREHGSRSVAARSSSPDEDEPVTLRRVPAAVRQGAPRTAALLAHEIERQHAAIDTPGKADPSHRAPPPR